MRSRRSFNLAHGSPSTKAIQRTSSLKMNIIWHNWATSKSSSVDSGYLRIGKPSICKIVDIIDIFIGLPLSRYGYSQKHSILSTNKMIVYELCVWYPSPVRICDGKDTLMIDCLFLSVKSVLHMMLYT